MALPLAGNTGFGDGLARTYASTVSKLTDNSSFKIPLRFPVDINGKLGFIFSETEMTKAAEEYKYAIVMKFLGVRPSIDVIRLNVAKTWSSVEILMISFMDDYHVLIQMKNERDFVQGWVREGRVMEGNSFRLFKWTKDFDLRKESPLAPQWIFLPELPMHLYQRDCLQIFATRFGRYLGTDNATWNRSRAMGARICVEGVRLQVTREEMNANVVQVENVDEVPNSITNGMTSNIEGESAKINQSGKVSSTISHAVMPKDPLEELVKRVENQKGVMMKNVKRFGVIKRVKWLRNFRSCKKMRFLMCQSPWLMSRRM
ncbi:hypothetical protein Ddye_016368 [Dipteronia dyeriana]|uniref:DUF4283 domain-containing protein n=1 Tax=Dipteronia dyeriana TaxID=168575 RepID=A0AAD9U743_9ROSI|nr:hypothetical protein Ddye_016368 [Dipteronia dyeriana]